MSALTIAQRAIREPLLHFVLIGALLFGLDARLNGGTGSHRVVVSKEVTASLSEQYAVSMGRPPNDAELGELITRWTDEEILFRAGVARGLDKDDARIRERVALKMTRILEEGVVLAEPAEPELRAWFDEHEARFAAPPLVDFTQVFVAGEGDGAKSRAAELLAALRGGAEPAGMGDPFQGGRRYRHRKIADLATTFGEPFVAGLSAQAVNTWALRSSRHGQHLVRVDSITPGAAPDFETARRDVEKHHRDAKRAEGIAKAMDRLRAEGTVVRE